MVMAFRMNLSRIGIQNLCKWGKAIKHTAALSVLDPGYESGRATSSDEDTTHLQSPSQAKAPSPSLSLERIGEEDLMFGQIREKYSKLSEFRGKKLELSDILEKFGVLWESVFFPLNPEYFLHTDATMLVGFSRELGPLLQSGVEEYPDDIKEVSSDAPSLEPGEYVDAFSLLSWFGDELVRNNGDRVVLHPDTFLGKNVLICCFHVPVPALHLVDFQSLMDLCKELYSTRGDEFEMVMVARMNSLANAQEVFDHFFSGFPSSCLAVPFKDSKSRDLICKVLHLGPRSKQFGCLYLNANGKVSPFFTCSEYIIEYYGAEAFPFTEKDIIESDNKCREIIDKAGCLESVLRCNATSPNYVHRAGGVEQVLISQLSSNNHIGLLLCCRGDLIPDLLDMYEQCRGKQLGFEIVVVYMPCSTGADPQIFKAQMDDLLRKHNACSWWCLPFDHSVSQRFWRLTHMHDNRIDQHCSMDRLIVVGPGVGRLDMYGADVMRRNGIEGYPFTTEAVIQDKIMKLRGFTLDSLFEGTDIPVEELRGREVFIIIDGVEGNSNLNTLVPIYPEIKKEFACELIFVEVGCHLVSNEKRTEIKPGLVRYFCPVFGRIRESELVSDEERSEITSKMPWRVCSTINTSLMGFMGELGLFPALVGFGCDGRIGSATDIFLHHFSEEDFSSVNSLYDDVESLLGYDEFNDRAMTFFSHSLSCLFVKESDVQEMVRFCIDHRGMNE